MKEVKIGVGSTNPVKIAAVQEAFAQVWPESNWIAEGMAAASGVSDQPMSDRESLIGATNRAKQALEFPEAEWGVGLEGGVDVIDGQYFDCGWIVVMDQSGRIGRGCTIRMPVPNKMVEMIHQGMELGHIDDLLFNQSNSKQQGGHFSLMTNGLLTRQSEYRHAVIAALSRFMQPELFETEG